MRRLATIVATAVAVTALTMSLPTTADAAPATGQWVYYNQYPLQSICVYVGNQLVAGGTDEAYKCVAGTPDQIALWVMPYS